jgi:hypothetical protein
MAKIDQSGVVEMAWTAFWNAAAEPLQDDYINQRALD